jgi:hypothetical protein
MLCVPDADDMPHGMRLRRLTALCPEACVSVQSQRITLPELQQSLRGPDQHA